MKTSANVVDVHRLYGNTRGGAASAADAMMSVRFSPDGDWIAAAASSGVVHFFGPHGASTFAPAGLADQVATTSMRFAPVEALAPDTPPGEYRVCASLSNGVVSQWRIVPKKLYECIAQAREPGNETMIAEYSPSGRQIAAAGSDAKVRLYDATVTSALSSPLSKSLAGIAEMPLVHTFETGIDRHGQATLGHNSRVFAIHWVDEFTFVSAGWESSVMLFDSRCGTTAQRAIEGPRIAGDGLEMMGTTLVTASDRAEKQLQTFDIGTGKELASITVPNTKLFGVRSVAGDRAPLAWVVGHLDNVAHCYNLNTKQPICSITESPEPFFAVDTKPGQPTTVAIVGGHNAAYRVIVSYD